MGRIIKGPKDSTSKAERSPTPEPVKYAEGGRIIEKDVYKAQILARDILKEGELARKRKLADARRITTQAKEEALASSAAEAFNETAKNTIEIFAERSRYLSDVAEDVRALSSEIAQKILGGPLKLDVKEQNEIVKNGVHKLRTKRKVTIQCKTGSLQSIELKAPGLLNRIEQEPDIDIEEIGDIKPGYFRIVTDAGAALCDESVAITALQQSFHE